MTGTGFDRDVTRYRMRMSAVRALVPRGVYEFSVGVDDRKTKLMMYFDGDHIGISQYFPLGGEVDNPDTVCMAAFGVGIDTMKGACMDMKAGQQVNW